MWNSEEHPRDERGRFISLYEFEERENARIEAEDAARAANRAANPKLPRFSRPADVDVPVGSDWWNRTDHYYIQDGVPEIPTPLFHGSKHEGGFKPGDLITPRSKKVAHATRSLGTARVFARTGVYLVEPVDGWTEHVWQQKMKYTQGEHHTEHVTKGNYRVIREVKPDETDADFDLTRRARRETWMAFYRVAWCPDCTQYHTPENHRPKA